MLKFHYSVHCYPEKPLYVADFVQADFGDGANKCWGIMRSFKTKKQALAFLRRMRSVTATLKRCKITMRDEVRWPVKIL